MAGDSGFNEFFSTTAKRLPLGLLFVLACLWLFLAYVVQPLIEKGSFEVAVKMALVLLLIIVVVGGIAQVGAWIMKKKGPDATQEARIQTIEETLATFIALFPYRLNSKSEKPLPSEVADALAEAEAGNTEKAEQLLANFNANRKKGSHGS